MIVGITGRKRAGKDEFAQALAAALAARGLRSVRVAYADRLKGGCARVFGIPIADMHDASAKDGALPAPILIDDHVHLLEAEFGLEIRRAGGRARTVRELLQLVGSEYVRRSRPAYWVDVAIEKAESATSAGAIALMPDVRFDNEAVAVRSRHGAVVEVVKQGAAYAADHHASEAGVDPALVDYRVEAATGALDVLHRSAEWLCARLLGTAP